MAVRIFSLMFHSGYCRNAEFASWLGLNQVGFSAGCFCFESRGITAMGGQTITHWELLPSPRAMYAWGVARGAVTISVISAMCSEPPN